MRQVRVFEPYLQYVELTLTGAAIQRKRIRIPKSLQNLGASKHLEGKLKTTFDLIEKSSTVSSKAIEEELNEIRKNFTPSLGKEHGRVVLKSAKPILMQRLDDLRKKLEEHREKVENELQTQLDESRRQIIEYYFPLARKNPPDALIGSLFDVDDASIRTWIEQQLDTVFPTADELIQDMELREHFKDITYETLNQTDFLTALKTAFPKINWDNPYNEFKAAAEQES